MNIVIHYCGCERFVLMFDDDHVAEAYKTLGRWAANPLLKFDWLDAVKMSKEIRVAEGCVGK